MTMGREQHEWWLVPPNVSGASTAAGAACGSSKDGVRRRAAGGRQGSLPSTRPPPPPPPSDGARRARTPALHPWSSPTDRRRSVSPAGQVLLVVGVLAVLHVPLGNYLARVYTASAHGRVEMLIFRLGRIDPEADQRWPVYLTSLLAFSAVGVGALYLLLRLQGHLPYSLGHPGMSPALAFDTAVSFTTNTSWQSYSGESTLGHTALAVGLGTQAFLSLAVGMAAADQRDRGRHADRQGEERLGAEADGERGVAEVGFAGVGLPAGVGGEADRRVEGECRAHAGVAEGIGPVPLQPQQQVERSDAHRAERQQRGQVDRPPLVGFRVDASQPEDQHLHPPVR